MAAARPLVSVYDEKNEAVQAKEVHLPAVFRAPIRPDIVSFIHDKMMKNTRQAYAVSSKAGHQTSAASWGTGRAVARIPRVRGGGTHRSGQAAYGNMCRSGRMFAPTKTWRRWHHRLNTNQKRFAMCSAIAASGVPALVMSKGHKIEGISEVPLVVDDKIESLQKTKDAVALLRRLKAWPDVEKVVKSKRLRAGKGKMRNRRRIMRTGPCVIYANDNGVTRAFRNIPGITLLNVARMNLLNLAPGGHVGRFCIWSESAISKLDALYGTWANPSTVKTNYNLPQPLMNNSDLTKLLSSQEIQSALRAKKSGSLRTGFKKNPLKSADEMAKLNPFSVAQKRAALMEEKKNIVLKEKRPAEEGAESKKSGKRARMAALKEADQKRASAKSAAAAKRQGKKDEAQAAKEAALAAREVPRCDEEFVVVEKEELPAHVELPREILDLAATSTSAGASGGDAAEGAASVSAEEETVPEEPSLDEGAVQEPPMETDSTSVVESEATAIMQESNLPVPPTPPPVDEAPIACSISTAAEAPVIIIEEEAPEAPVIIIEEAADPNVLVIEEDTESEDEEPSIILVEAPAAEVDAAPEPAVEAMDVAEEVPAAAEPVVEAAAEAETAAAPEVVEVAAAEEPVIEEVPAAEPVADEVNEVPVSESVEESASPAPAVEEVADEAVPVEAPVAVEAAPVEAATGVIIVEEDEVPTEGAPVLEVEAAAPAPVEEPAPAPVADEVTTAEGAIGLIVVEEEEIPAEEAPVLVVLEAATEEVSITEESPAPSQVPAVVISPPVTEEEEPDAFDFFTPEPIGSAARDLERQQEEEAAAAAAAAASADDVADAVVAADVVDEVVEAPLAAEAPSVAVVEAMEVEVSAAPPAEVDAPLEDAPMEPESVALEAPEVPAEEAVDSPSEDLD